MVPKLYIIRGLPGSGKTTLAEKLRLSGEVDFRFEADMYFYDEHGFYNFDGSKLGNAHDWCQRNVNRALIGGHSVAVSNTFVKLWEMEPYLLMAKNRDAHVQILECHGKFRSVHGVPQETIDRMRSNWEPTSNLEHEIYLSGS